METERAKENCDKPEHPKMSGRLQMIYLYWVIVLIDLLGDWTRTVNLQLFKPIPILLLILNAKRETRRQKVIFYGLLFSIVGDLCLMSDSLLVFQIGTAAFLIAHLLYIRSFVYDISYSSLKPSSGRKGVFKMFSIVVILSLLVHNVTDLWDKTPNRMLFTTYGIALSMMAICSIIRNKENLQQKESYWKIVFGALLFGISDNTLATLKFNGIHSDEGRCFIMLTYYAAQFLIFTGTN